MKREAAGLNSRVFLHSLFLESTVPEADEYEIPPLASLVPTASLASQKSGLSRASTTSTFNSASRPYRLRFHTGAIDQRALTNRNPIELLSDLIMMLRENGFYVRQSNSDSSSFKLKIVRPAKAVEKSDPNVIRNPEIEKEPRVPGNFMRNLASFPRGFVEKMKYRSKYGTGYNKGYNQSHPEEEGKGGGEGEIKFYVEVQKIKNLEGLFVVEFKRRAGDVWEFKKVYQSLLPKMRLEFVGGGVV
jgi:hypothetical protein